MSHQRKTRKAPTRFLTPQPFSTGATSMKTPNTRDAIALTLSSHGHRRKRKSLFARYARHCRAPGRWLIFPQLDWRITLWAWLMFVSLDLNRKNINRAISDNMLKELSASDRLQAQEQYSQRCRNEYE